MHYSHISQVAGGSSPRPEADDGPATGLLPVPTVEGKEALKGLNLAIKCPDSELTHIARILHEYSKPQGGGSTFPLDSWEKKVHSK